MCKTQRKVAIRTEREQKKLKDKKKQKNIKHQIENSFFFFIPSKVHLTQKFAYTIWVEI